MIHPLVARIGRTRAFTVLAPHVLPRLDRAGHVLTRGRWVPSRLLLPTVMLTTTGHRTGLSRHTPLCADHHDDGSWLVAATNFGRPHHPAWSTNLLRYPHATITVGGRAHPVSAALLTPEQQARQRPRILRILPIYDQYAARAARDIRVFRLTPIEHDR